MDRSMSVTGYVDMAFDDVMRVFGDEETIDELLGAAVGTAFPGVRVHASAPEQIAARSARLKVAWARVDRQGPEDEGAVSIQLLVLQSGREPVTELLVTLAVDEVQAHSVAMGLHRALDELTIRLMKMPA